MRRLLLVLPLLIVLALGFIGVTASSGGGGDGGGQAAAPAEGGGAASDGAVEIVDFQFGPKDATVAAGTEVVWTNQDGAPHSIQDDSGEELFEESEDMAQGDTFAFTYDEAGEYAYLCGIHNYMTGTVTVTG